MNWLVKVGAFKLLSALPGGAALYRYSQRRITRSIVPTPERIRQKIDVGLRYWDWLESHDGGKTLLRGTHLDFGAGWHPTIPLLFYSLGLERQELADVVPLLNRELIDETVRVFRQIVEAPQWPHRSRLRRLPEINSTPGLPWPEYLGKMGIACHAPCQGWLDGINGEVEIATSTQVLYYIGRDTLRGCFRAIHRALKPGGKFLATIHLNDTHANAQNGLSQYNHLRFSPFAWEKCVNSQLMSNNRLKARDYRELLDEAGFEAVHFEVDGPTAADLRELERIPVHGCFSRHSREELGAKHLFFVARKN